MNTVITIIINIKNKIKKNPIDKLLRKTLENLKIIKKKSQTEDML